MDLQSLVICYRKIQTISLGAYDFERLFLRGLYSEGRFNGGFFVLRVWGAYIWRGLLSEFYGIFTSGCAVVRYSSVFRERLSEKVHATIPKGIVGGFEFAVLQRKLIEWHERP